VFERLAIRGTVGMEIMPNVVSPGREDLAEDSSLFLVPMYRGDQRLHLAYNSSLLQDCPLV